MKLEVADDFEDLGERAFRHVEKRLARKKEPVVVLPTGNTPLGLYAACVRHGSGSAIARARFVQLDEYLGIAADDRRSLSGWLDRVLLGPLSIGRERLIGFDSATSDPDREAARVERETRSAGIDLAILGLGPNGHLGFNEPGSDFGSSSRAVPLTPASIKSNAVYWGGESEVPRRAFTLGLGTLARAKASLLLVSGAHKRQILARVLEEEPSPDVPATCLRGMRNVTVIADRAALGRRRSAT
jgi:glucosamine-6-phosphate deaminase